MRKVCFVTEGVLPVPPIKGGAVGELIECLNRQNTLKKRCIFTTISIFDSSFSLMTQADDYVSYIYFKSFFLARFFDKVIFTVVAKIFRKKNSEKFKCILQRLSYLKKVKKHFKKAHYDDVVLEGNTTLLFLIKTIKKHSRNTKIYFHLHNNVSSLYGKKKDLEFIHGLIGNSAYVINNFCSSFDCCHDVKKFILFNCVSSLTETKKYNIREKYNIGKTTKIVLYVGRLTEQKGVLELIESFSNIPNDNCCLLLVGSALFGLKTSNHYEKKIRDCSSKLGDKIIFTGYIPRSELHNFYRQSDVGVFPSLYGEAAGLSIIEAMSYGLKTISTNVGGIPEYVGSTDAILLDPSQPDFIQHIGYSIHSCLNKEKTEPPSRYINTNFSESVFYDNFMDIIYEQKNN